MNDADNDSAQAVARSFMSSEGQCVEDGIPCVGAGCEDYGVLDYQATRLSDAASRKSKLPAISGWQMCHDQD